MLDKQTIGKILLHYFLSCAPGNGVPIHRVPEIKLLTVFRPKSYSPNKFLIAGEFLGMPGYYSHADHGLKRKAAVIMSNTKISEYIFYVTDV